MRNLISFIRKYSFFFLFLLFEGAAFYFLFKNNTFQRSSFLNSTNVISANVYQKYANLSDYIGLKEVNDELSAENIRLRAQQIESYERIFGENISVKDTLFKRKYLYTKAKVINNSVNRQNNYLTLNVGSNSGIESGMGVMGPNGVVGIVKNVSASFSTVLSLLHREAKISAKLKKTDYYGSLEWDGVNYLEAKVNDIPNFVPLTIGDTIITSGYSATFPEGIKVATIKEFSKPDGENFYDIKVRLLNDFKQLSIVYVIKNKIKLEQTELEKDTKVEDD